jgi:hypothetical protein
MRVPELLIREAQRDLAAWIGKWQVTLTGHSR